MYELNAEGFIYNAKTYKEEFQHLLHGLVACYMIMMADNIELSNNEIAIRDKLLEDYLHNDDVRVSTGLLDFIFNKEVDEDKTKGRADIKIEIKNRFRRTAAYYIIECKRLDNKNTLGISGLNAEYIKNGIYRFVNRLYSTTCKINAMIGFVVEKMDIQSNIIEINLLSKTHFKEQTRMIQEITQENFISGFNYHYSSTHNDRNDNEFTLFHLMFDVSECIKKEKACE